MGRFFKILYGIFAPLLNGVGTVILKIGKEEVLKHIDHYCQSCKGLERESCSGTIFGKVD